MNANTNPQNKRGQSESPKRDSNKTKSRPPYYNEAIELELVLFKREIE